MVKKYKIRATRDFPGGRPYVEGEPPHLRFSSRGALYPSRKAFEIWQRVNTDQPRSNWIMGPVDE